MIKKTTQSHYHDEWAVKKSGGGQELVQVGTDTFTRVYAGGIASAEKLKELKLKDADILRFLLMTLHKAGTATRFDQPYQLEENNWRYEYRVVQNDTGIPVVTSREEIFFQNQLVFLHVFLLSAVE